MVDPVGVGDATHDAGRPRSVHAQDADGRGGTGWAGEKVALHARDAPGNPRQHQVLGLEQEAVTDKGAGRHAHQDTAAVKATTAMAAMVTPESKRIVSKRSTAAA